MASKTRAEKMEETREKLIAAGRKAFAEKGFSAASMDELTAEAGLTRGALYHNFGDKQGLMAAVVDQIDTAMAAKAQAAGEKAGGGWKGLMAEGAAYIEMALEPEVQRIVLLDGPAVLGDPSQWPSQNRCLQATIATLRDLAADGRIKAIDIEALARLLNGVALNAALWVAASDNARATLPKAIAAFECLASGVLNTEADAVGEFC
ncbi:MAG: TetR/AcrR family transcriptional regulator [Jannaschia helgolandensis]|uniref:Transcriptional regulator, TetR family n=1 Tax=Jannaschia helgolandensis TaxID=188906 RepID=A0A1H7HM94_9RHOB|nr:TetR/AcrR family transcriptional regulator [Jannaschia helgolandensis]SEK50120.1 transcriptional regulator, TetR family [Jannaschia helgolandensis]